MEYVPSKCSPNYQIPNISSNRRRYRPSGRLGMHEGYSFSLQKCTGPSRLLRFAMEGRRICKGVEYIHFSIEEYTH